MAVDVTIKVGADAKAAESVINDVADKTDKRLQETAKRTQEAAAKATGGAPGEEGGAPVDTKQAARDMADEFGRRAGQTLGKFVMSYMADQGLGTAFALMKSPGRDNSRIDQAESAVRGALQWGAAGAQVAGPMGAVVGGLLGGLNNFILKEKEIRDSLERSKVDYSRDRRNAEVASARNQDQRAFEWRLGHMTPQEQVAALQRRRTELMGSGKTGNAIIDEYNALVAQRDALANKRSMTGPMGVTVNTQSERDRKLEERLNQRIDHIEDIFDRAAKGMSTDSLGRPLSIGGNMAGTTQFYEAVRLFAHQTYGENDNRTADLLSKRTAVDSQVDTLKEKELGVYLGEFDRVLGLASRSAITDSLSSKGLGIGAQVGAMGNDRLLNIVQDFMKMARQGNKDLVDVIREQGGMSSVMAAVVK